MFRFDSEHSYSKRFIYKLIDESNFPNILDWAQQFECIMYLDSNDYYKAHKSQFFYNNYDYILGISYLSEEKYSFKSLPALEERLKENKDWLMGYFSYDLKNELFDLSSENKAGLGFENLSFFIPDLVVYKTKGEVVLESKAHIDVVALSREIEQYKSKITDIVKDEQIAIKSRFSKEEYLDTVKKVKAEIQYGNVYELNFCQEFYNDHCCIDPWESYKKLTQISPTPFSAYFKQADLHLISASPERYLTKRSETIISQPIKGTIRKSGNQKEDIGLVDELKNNPKEQAENVMIVDLVRNDLSQTAQKGSVEVEELCGIYPFKQLYQMISTVKSRLREDKTAMDVIKTSFPMGSMTGAPKVSAMQLIEKYEKTKRELYSGSVGYFSPDGDFDFSVVIRSILYNESSRYLSFTVGSAITIKSDEELEYEECLLKAQAIRESL